MMKKAARRILILLPFILFCVMTFSIFLTYHITGNVSEFLERANVIGNLFIFLIRAILIVNLIRIIKRFGSKKAKPISIRTKMRTIILFCLCVIATVLMFSVEMIDYLFFSISIAVWFAFYPLTDPRSIMLILLILFVWLVTAKKLTAAQL